MPARWVHDGGAGMGTRGRGQEGTLPERVSSGLRTQGPRTLSWVSGSCLSPLSAEHLDEAWYRLHPTWQPLWPIQTDAADFSA